MIYGLYNFGGRLICPMIHQCQPWTSWFGQRGHGFIYPTMPALLDWTASLIKSLSLLCSSSRFWGSFTSGMQAAAGIWNGAGSQGWRSECSPVRTNKLSGWLAPWMTAGGSILLLLWCKILERFVPFYHQHGGNHSIKNNITKQKRPASMQWSHDNAQLWITLL
jgi:hypothetical protein